LILCTTFHSTSKMNAVFQKELAAMPAETRHKILMLEKAGLYGKGKASEKNRYPSAHAAVGNYCSISVLLSLLCAAKFAWDCSFLASSS
jgi:hypothetical protein